MKKKYIVGLSKTHTMHPESVKQFFEVYPDGKLLSVIRDPGKWIRATSAHGKKNYPDAQSAVNHWRDSTKAMIRNKEVFGNRVCMVRHEDLTGNTEIVMRLDVGTSCRRPSAVNRFKNAFFMSPDH